MPSSFSSSVSFSWVETAKPAARNAAAAAEADWPVTLGTETFSSSAAGGPVETVMVTEAPRSVDVPADGVCETTSSLG